MKYFVFLMVVIGIFVRLYRLEESSHFAFDESRDLVNMHQIWVEKKLTLVGPISEDRSHANSSLTYYMLLPFAALFDFEPIGPVIGSVFWGLLTSILMYLVLKRINPEFSKYAAIISAIWIPLVITSRWAWNPNNLTFWIFLALYLDKYKHWIFRFLVGLFMGLAFHHHNLAIIPIFIWTIYKRNLFVALGVACSFLPFVIFDLRHAPGIFLVKMIGYNKGSFEQNLLDLIQKIPTMINYYFNFLFQNKWFAVLGIFLTFIVAIKELFYKNANRIWFVLWFFSLVPLVLYKNNNHYFLPGIPFFIIWLFVYGKDY